MSRMIAFGVMFLCWGMVSCGSDGGDGVLDYSTRIAIDTQTNNAISRLHIEADRYCRDSTEGMKQHFIDSLLQKRRLEMQRTLQALPEQPK